VMCESSTNECGNGVLDPGEECDDGNALNLDGCGWTVVGGVRVECVVEANWVCEPVKRHACAENRAGCDEAGDANDARCVCADEPVAFVDGVEQHDISVCACPGPVVAGGCQPA
jgi:cysteine-rich repeat protein